jgi:hypothetical protein
LKVCHARVEYIILLRTIVITKVMARQLLTIGAGNSAVAMFASDCAGMMTKGWALGEAYSMLVELDVVGISVSPVIRAAQ